MHKIWSVFPGIFTIHAWSCSWSYVFFFFLLLLHLSIIRIWSNASLELIPNVSNYHELLLGRRACMRRLHSKGNGIMVLINLKLHPNLCSSGNFHFEQQYAFSHKERCLPFYLTYVQQIAWTDKWDLQQVLDYRDD